jgi:hypothetical protein
MSMEDTIFLDVTLYLTFQKDVVSNIVFEEEHK